MIDVDYKFVTFLLPIPSWETMTSGNIPNVPEAKFLRGNIMLPHRNLKGSKDPTQMAVKLGLLEFVLVTCLVLIIAATAVCCLWSQLRLRREMGTTSHRRRRMRSQLDLEVDFQQETLVAPLLTPSYPRPEAIAGSRARSLPVSTVSDENAARYSICYSSNHAASSGSKSSVSPSGPKNLDTNTLQPLIEMYAARSPVSSLSNHPTWRATKSTDTTTRQRTWTPSLRRVRWRLVLIALQTGHQR